MSDEFQDAYSYFEALGFRIVETRVICTDSKCIYHKKGSDCEISEMLKDQPRMTENGCTCKVEKDE